MSSTAVDVASGIAEIKEQMQKLKEQFESVSATFKEKDKPSWEECDKCLGEIHGIEDSLRNLRQQLEQNSQSIPVQNPGSSAASSTQYSPNPLTDAQQALDDLNTRIKHFKGQGGATLVRNESKTNNLKDKLVDALVDEKEEKKNKVKYRDRQEQYNYLVQSNIIYDKFIMMRILLRTPEGFTALTVDNPNTEKSKLPKHMTAETLDKLLDPKCEATREYLSDLLSTAANQLKMKIKESNADLLHLETCIIETYLNQRRKDLYKVEINGDFEQPIKPEHEKRIQKAIPEFEDLVKYNETRHPGHLKKYLNSLEEQKAPLENQLKEAQKKLSELQTAGKGSELEQDKKKLETQIKQLNQKLKILNHDIDCLQKTFPNLLQSQTTQAEASASAPSSSQPILRAAKYASSSSSSNSGMTPAQPVAAAAASSSSSSSPTPYQTETSRSRSSSGVASSDKPKKSESTLFERLMGKGDRSSSSPSRSRTSSTSDSSQTTQATQHDARRGSNPVIPATLQSSTATNNAGQPQSSNSSSTSGTSATSTAASLSRR